MLHFEPLLFLFQSLDQSFLTLSMAPKYWNSLTISKTTSSSLSSVFSSFSSNLIIFVFFLLIFNPTLHAACFNMCAPLSVSFNKLHRVFRSFANPRTCILRTPIIIPVGSFLNFLMVISNAKLINIGDSASPCFRSVFTSNASDSVLPSLYLILCILHTYFG